jgi:PKD repeat protein
MVSFPGNCQPLLTCLGETQWPTQSINPTSSWSDIDACNYAGDYAVINVESTSTYQFSTCLDDGSNIEEYDTELKLTDMNGNSLAYNNDYCGTSSFISWQADFTGQVQIHLMQYLCYANQICSNVRIRSFNSPVNDNYSGAIQLPVYGDQDCSPNLTTGTLNACVLAVPEGPTDYGSICGTLVDGYDVADVWYEFVATSPQHKIHLNTTGFNAILELWDQAQFVTIATPPIACTNTTCSISDNETETICADNLTIGNTYKIRISNESIIDPTFFESMDFTIYLSTSYQTSSINCQTSETISSSANCASPILVNTLSTNGKMWYKFIATSDEHTINVTPSYLYDPEIKIYSGLDQFCNGMSLINTYNLTGIGEDESFVADNLVVGDYYYLEIDHVGNQPPCTSTFELCLIGTSSGSAPVADFVVNQTTVPTGTTVSFTDQSTNSPTSWSWSLTPATGWAYAAGTSGSSQNPQITFNTEGSYTVAMTATNATGSDTETKSNYITVTSNAALSENVFESFSIYPNPTRNSFTISSVKVINSEFKIIDSQGREVLAGTMNEQEHTIDISKLSKGVYYVVFDNTEYPVVSVIKE